MSSTKNIYSLETIFTIVHDIKKLNGKRIGVTHGAFDLFHVGHLHLLKETAKQCDFLIVGVESDENMAKYKGSKRPIISQQNRLELIAELSCVDAVFVNDTTVRSDDYVDLYKELKADIVSIGRNFSFEERARIDAEKASAKLVKIANDKESTTRIISKILQKYNQPIGDNR